MRPSAWFLRHLVGPDLEVRSEQVRTVPAIGQTAPEYQLPSRIDAGLAASRHRVRGRLRAARAQVQAENDLARERGY